MLVKRSNHLLKCFFILSLGFFYCMSSFARQQSKQLGTILKLRDSIFLELQKPDQDTAGMDHLFYLICKNRRPFKEKYKPLLIEYVDHSLRLDYAKGLMQGLDRLGLQERFDENYELAIQYHNQSLDIARHLGDSVQMTYNYNNLGQAYRKQDINGLAIKYFHKALEIQEALGDEKAASFTQNTLGATYLVQEDYESAKYYLGQSIQLAEKRNDKRTVSYNYGTLGEIYLEQNQPDSAMYFFREARKLKEELNYSKGIAVSDHLIGQAYYAKGDLENAAQCFKKALEAHVKYDNDRYQALCNVYLGKIMISWNNDDQALDYLMKAREIATQVHSIENLILVNEALFELYQKKGLWPDAIEALQKTQSWKDSIMSARNERELQALEVEYQTHKKEQRIELLSAENKIKNQSIRLGIAVIVILLLSIALGVYAYMNRRKRANQQQERLKQQLLKSQMNPHFIFNALGSIQSFMYRNDAKSAARYMGNFASLTRSILQNSGTEQVPLTEEIKTLEDYLHLERMRMNASFDFNMEVDDDLETDFIEIPPMMIQPFVENAIKHGIRELNKKGMIILRFKDEQSRLKVEVIDNGVGVNQTLTEEKKGRRSMATTIFNQRIRLLRNSYRDLPQPMIEDLSGQSGSGTRVLFYLPIMEPVAPALN